MGLINFSGIASGIDTEGLIKATADSTRATRIRPLQDKVTDLTSTDDSLSELKNRLIKLKDSSAKFATLAGGGIVKSATSSDESIVGATSSNSAYNGTYTVTVDAKAKNGVFTFTDAFTSLDQVVDADLTVASYPGTSDRQFTVNIGTGANLKSLAISLTETSTFSSIINSFNTDPTMSTVGVMSAVNVSTVPGSPSYRLVISSLNEGTEKGTIAITARGAGIIAEAKFDDTLATQQTASNAQFDIAGIGLDIVRATNTVTDVIPGVTLNLQKSSVTPATISVQNDVASSRAKIEDFVSAWNDIVTYMNEQNLIQRQEDGRNVTNTFAPLSKTRVDEGALGAIRSALASTRVSLGFNAEGLEESLIMASIGLKTNQNGTITFTPATVGGVPSFDELVATKPEAVNSLLKKFGDSLSLTAGTIDLYTGPLRLIDLTVNSNKRQITDFNRRIAEAEKSIDTTSSALRQRYARLESQMGRLQAQQQQLSQTLR